MTLNAPEGQATLAGELVDSVSSREFHGRLSRQCIATVLVEEETCLGTASELSLAVNSILMLEEVQSISEIAHEFDNGGFTMVFLLAESHICVHTWPERLAVQLDVFLCSYLRDNTVKCESIFQQIVDHFNPIHVDRTFINRE